MLVLLGSREEYFATVAGWVSRVIGKRFRLLRSTNRTMVPADLVELKSDETRIFFKTSAPSATRRCSMLFGSFAGPSQHSLFGFFLVNFAAPTHLENDRSTPKSSSFHTEHHDVLIVGSRGGGSHQPATEHDWIISLNLCGETSLRTQPIIHGYSQTLFDLSMVSNRLDDQ